VYSFKEDKFIKEDLNGLINYDFSLFFKDKQDDIYLLTAKKEIYRYQPGSWKPFASLDQIDSTRRIFQVCIDSLQNIWALTSAEIFVKYAGSSELHSYFKPEIKDVYFRRMNFDKA